jgi:hypothetical protein
MGLKMSWFILLVGALCLLVGCRQKEDEYINVSKERLVSENKTQVMSKMYAFDEKYVDIDIRIDSKETVLRKLGIPNSVVTENLKVRVEQFNNMETTTYIYNNLGVYFLGNIFSSFTILDKQYKTSQGVGIGSSKKDIERAYGIALGEYYDSEYAYVDNIAYYGLAFTLSENIVEKIRFFAVFD